MVRGAEETLQALVPQSVRELRHYRDLLVLKRAEIVGDLSSLETEALRSSGGDLSHMPIHMADIGSDTYEQDFMLGLAANERQRLREIVDSRTADLITPRVAGKERVAKGFYFEPFDWFILVSEERDTFYSQVNQITQRTGIMTITKGMP